MINRERFSPKIKPLDDDVEDRYDFSTKAPLPGEPDRRLHPLGGLPQPTPEWVLKAWDKAAKSKNANKPK